jgi:hypothetical protein
LRADVEGLLTDSLLVAWTFLAFALLLVFDFERRLPARLTRDFLALDVLRDDLFALRAIGEPLRS